MKEARQEESEGDSEEENIVGGQIRNKKKIINTIKEKGKVDIRQ